MTCLFTDVTNIGTHKLVRDKSILVCVAIAKPQVILVSLAMKGEEKDHFGRFCTFSKTIGDTEIFIKGDL